MNNVHMNHVVWSLAELFICPSFDKHYHIRSTLLSKGITKHYTCAVFLGAGAGQSTARIASSNTVLSPLVVNAEHSRYLTAPTSLAMERPILLQLQYDKIQKALDDVWPFMFTKAYKDHCVLF